MVVVKEIRRRREREVGKRHGEQMVRGVEQGIPCGGDDKRPDKLLEFEAGLLRLREQVLYGMS